MSIILNKDSQLVSKVIICVGEENISAQTSTLIESELFKKSTKDMFTTSSVEDGKVVVTTYLYAEKDLSDEKLREVYCLPIKDMARRKVNSYAICFDGEADCDFIKKSLPLFGEVFGMVTYKFEGYKSVKPPVSETTIEFVCDVAQGEFDQLVAQGLNIAQGVNVARDTINAPSDVITPRAFAELATERGKECGFEVAVYNEKELAEMGFGGLLAVGRGALNETTLAVLKYTGDKPDVPYTAVIGKGVTFDAGGYHLKDTASIGFMKVDMGGAAAALGATCAVAQNKVKANLLTVIPLCENLIGKEAFIPGCVITMLSKKTVEITNTDAEGRLIMADGLHFASEKEEVGRVIDIATLTGATAIIFGGACAAVTTNNSEFLDELQKSSDYCGEKIWQLPMFDKYKDRIMSKIADYCNSPMSKTAGAIAAGMFLREFVNQKPWVHIDIAGITVAMADENYTPPGPIGYGVRLIYNLLNESEG